VTAAQTAMTVFLFANAVLVLAWLWHQVAASASRTVGRWLGVVLVYELLAIGSIAMMVPFYWMLVTSFKDSETALTFPPVWTPSRKQYLYDDLETGEKIAIRLLGIARNKGDLVDAVPADAMEFRSVDAGDYNVTREEPREGTPRFKVDPSTLESRLTLQVDGRNYRKAWYAPEVATRGSVNFGRYFFVSLFAGLLSTTGTLLTSALAAFAFARMNFPGKGIFFYLVLTTMMVPGQVLLIPNFLTLGTLGWLDTYLALIAPFLASVFTIFLMRQFFMTIPDDLWDAAQVDGMGRFRFLWGVVAPLSKPVFITAGIFLFLGNWNALLWPLIVTSTPQMRTLMVGLQTFNEEAGSEFELLMSASAMAVVPVVVLFFVLQRFFIQGIARTGLK